ncbi:uncharacterized protein LOC121265679 [Juglans microcarpa x Juglans regia]|uniref:uncharacterized protein LOC121265679 n=1 Tax=Juglans microcarpa x Juglans regia TaxID=2249226 RepID=UPI001B7ED10E|nr:uncharacterized protein LOC121265679 [Juglans microcarpa x Juglans regia]
MYPFEKYIGKFKWYVKNKARPEGSIVEAYIHIECLTFCSMYLQDIETKFTQIDRNIDGGEAENIDGFKIFNQKVRLMGVASNLQLSDKLLKEAIWYVLNNCAEIGHYLEEFYGKCKVHSPNCINRTHQTEFLTWFRKRVQDQRIINPLDVTADLYALA